LGAFSLLRGNFSRAEEHFLLGLKRAEEQDDLYIEYHFLRILGYLELRQGNPREALNYLDRAWSKLNVTRQDLWQIDILHERGITFVHLKELDQARIVAKTLRDLISKCMNENMIREYYHLMGSIEVEKGNYTQAENYFLDALALLPYEPLIHRADFFDSLARLYLKTGSNEKAIDIYEKIIRLTYGRLLYGDIYARAFYQLGEIYEQRGLKDQAIENYNEFIALWEMCDAEFQPMVQDARNRVKKLEENK
jgi:tetratricopeptide (TPR) repeat protein